ncbi:MAG TPA: hypothetical protein VKG01_06845 [Thermoanaerobaculia bacterium]|nr:hypothetical protein [Thermoanaerobaculia bacterium]
MKILMALAAAVAMAGTTPDKGPRPAVPFIADDYPRALAEARAKKLPIFVEAWAPW